MNPVLVREWKTFFRGTSPYYFLMFYVVLQLLIFLGVVYPLLKGGGIEFMMERAGRILVSRLFAGQLALILVLAPFLFVRIGAREKEEETIAFLRIVPYGYWKVVTWKFFTSTLILLLLIFIILPLFLFSLSIGGVTAVKLGFLFGTLLVLTICCGGISFFWTFVFYKSVYALVASYLSIFALSLIAYLSYPSTFILKFLSVIR